MSWVVAVEVRPGPVRRGYAEHGLAVKDRYGESWNGGAWSV